MHTELQATHCTIDHVYKKEEEIDEPKTKTSVRDKCSRQAKSVLLLTVLACPGVSLCLSVSLSVSSLYAGTVDRPVARPCIAHYDQL